MKYSEVTVKIKELRIKRGLTQTELAQLVGVSKSVISSYENAVHMPPYDILIKFSNIFGVSCDYLLGNTKQRTLSVDGLTQTQIESVELIIIELKNMNGKKE